MWKDYYLPSKIQEVLELLSDLRGHAKIIAGGTDLLLEFRKGLHTKVHALIDLKNVSTLNEISLDEEGWIHIGPLVTHNQCLVSEIIQLKAFPLSLACWQVGSAQIRNRGTIAGNLITSSPANDTIPPLMALGAVVTLRSKKEERIIPLGEFILGVRKNAMLPNEMLTDISFPAMKKTEVGSFMKMGLRKAQAISVVNAAIILDYTNKEINKAIIALGSVSPTVIRANQVEVFLQGRTLNPETIKKASELSIHSIMPISDVRSSAVYRSEMVSVLIRRILTTLMSGKERDSFPKHPITLGDQIFEVSKINDQSTKHFTEGTLIETTINGLDYQIPCREGTTLLALLREQSGLMGAKEGCAEGECGACTILLDGKATLSCLVPSPVAHNSSIVTVEGLKGLDVSDAVQESFIKNGAVQCGYCTPGMVISATALLRETEFAKLEREEIKKALSGNICRCTGYQKIVDASIEAAEFLRGEKRIIGGIHENKSVVGVSVDRIESRSMVEGSAIYTADMSMPGMLYGYTCRSEQPHAEILNIDISETKKIPGVVCVFKASDILGSKHFGIFVKDQQVLADSYVRYIGEPIALIAVEDPRIAKKAIKSIRVTYSSKQSIVDFEEALSIDNSKNLDLGGKIPVSQLIKGSIDEGFKQSKYVIEEEFKTQEIEHAYLETEAALAFITPDDNITIFSGVQHPHYTRKEVAAILGMPLNRVRIVQSKMGGGFGGKIDITLQHHAALLAQKTNRPVRMVYNREESIISSYKRMPYLIQSKIGADENGLLRAVKVDVMGDVGAYTSHGPALLGRAIVHCVGPYFVPNIEAHAFYTFTNKVPIGAMRGYGTPAMLFAMEQQMNKLSKTIGMDPLELRSINALKKGMETATGQKLENSVGLMETINQARKTAGWDL